MKVRKNLLLIMNHGDFSFLFLFIEGHPAPQHFIRVEHKHVIYVDDQQKSTSVPYEAPQFGSKCTIYLIQFMCYNSCIGGGKKPIEIIVTLENRLNI